MEISMETLDDVTDLPQSDQTRGRKGQFTEVVRAAAKDGKVRKVTGLPDDDAIKTVRRQLNHTVGSLDGKSFRSSITVEDDGSKVLYWQVIDTPDKVEGDAATAAVSPNGESSDTEGSPSPSKAQGKARKAS